jgi:2-haloacid dehalogenase
MLAAAVDNAELAPLFDQVLSVEAVGVYKPHARVYLLACQAASAFGMCVVWCNRRAERRERLPGNPDHEIRSLAELPALVIAGGPARQVRRPG